LLPENSSRPEEGIPTWSADGKSIVFGGLRKQFANPADKLPRDSIDPSLNRRRIFVIACRKGWSLVGSSQ
jgi:hypothetical protein